MPYPDAEMEIERLVQDHYATLGEDGQPLLLAVYYRSLEAPDDECLLEVAQNFGGNEVSGTGEMMQVEFGPTHRYPLGGHSLRLTLTNPDEYAFALRENWPEIQDVVDAARRREAKVIFPSSGEADHSTNVLSLLGAA